MSTARANILGVNASYHESAAALMSGGKLIAAAEEERFNRVKHGKSATIDNALLLPWSAIDYCLRAAGIEPDQLDYVGFSLDPAERLARNVGLPDEEEIAPFDYGTREGERRFAAFLEEAPRLLELRWHSPMAEKFMFLDHHACHAASAFFCSPFDEAAVLSVDGIGESASTVLYHGRDGDLKRLGSICYPHSLGFLWEKMTAFLGFKSNHDECKVMGLSSYGDPRKYRAAFDKLVEVGPDGDFKMNNEVLRFRAGGFGPLEKLLGKRRMAHEPLHYGGDNTIHADVAAALQSVTEEAMLRLCGRLRKATGARYLCMAGGVALNCVANGRIAHECGFDDLWIQPAANDAGTAVGAAAHISHTVCGAVDGPLMSHPYLGPGYDDTEIEKTLIRCGLPFRRIEEPEKLAARLVYDNDVVGWFQGRMEFGPRALGNRSILADPRDPNMVGELNLKVKHREPFRPFCPSVLSEKAGEWFELGGQAPLASKYMLCAFQTKPDRRRLIPAVVHVDGTSRIQLVNEEDNPLYHRLIRQFEALSGVPMVLNTSLNDTEPIVCSPDDAVKTFLKTNIDHLVIGRFAVSKKDVAGRRGR
ncbi:MAG: carbamoyltransferase C-terminal domain-containing protein [Planctomycetota bacterium]|nr:carbamoyltransferase C-terminal domain-containing protein [Planctomycetota bacterium]